MPTSDELSQFGDPESRQTVISHHQRRISKLLTQIISERDRILSTPDPPSTLSTTTTQPNISPKTSAVEMEQRQLATLKRRHQREVEQLITTLMTLDALQKDSEARDLLSKEKQLLIETERKRQRFESHERHLKHLRELEISEQTKLQTEKALRQQQFDRDIRIFKKLQNDAILKLETAKRAESERRERAEKNRERIEQIEQNKQLKILNEQRRIEEKEVQRIAILKAEQLEKQLEKEAILLKKKQKISPAK
jgi:hypothetical protein